MASSSSKKEGLDGKAWRKEGAMGKQHYRRVVFWQEYPSGIKLLVSNTTVIQYVCMQVLPIYSLMIASRALCQNYFLVDRLIEDI